MKKKKNEKEKKHKMNKLANDQINQNNTSTN